ncbi:ferric reductase-like transmembrane domain-containing protein [Waterburya agarophytonicola K14]|uniref:Ferric reductase-like transmembrane domain-containing protein n=1 Tax=Waterburya agarophytonicola KI4 TaxID=2874699 RepID=A0A964BT49_9CYAN|nr:ferric reductase-like transmembrane domain-containing protein [Waterburya agarophytonicola]MCC0178995.1 ferric reductase-like transmembrane domain-containing protein [Waterburya agarophytonicola KI4]
MKTKSKVLQQNQKAQQKLKKPLFPYGDWIAIVLGVIILSKTDGMGHHLGHAGIFFLMLALIARPISFWWNIPLKYRRTIGIFAFAATLAHAIYAFFHVLNGNVATISEMISRHQWGIWAGIIALATMTPAAITSFPFLQRKLGKRWRQIHLLTVPALALAALHTILIGPHYMAELQLELEDSLRTYGIVILTILVFLMRRRMFWSILRLRKMIK